MLWLQALYFPSKAKVVELSQAQDLERKPAIALCRARQLGRQDSCLKALKAGMEEEGVPWKELECGNESSISLSREGAEWSQLGVGVGIDAQGSISIHFHRLEHTEPLFYCEGTQATAVKARRLGANAARLVKGVPFKDESPLNV